MILPKNFLEFRSFILLLRRYKKTYHCPIRVQSRKLKRTLNLLRLFKADFSRVDCARTDFKRKKNALDRALNGYNFVKLDMKRT